jgi:hypothetical protein
VLGGRDVSKKFKKSDWNPSKGIYGMRIIIKSKNGKRAIKKLKATALARIETAPLIKPKTYISKRS